jgi:hypothetical protein
MLKLRQEKYGHTKDYSIEDLAEDTLDGFYSVEKTALNNSQAIGRLLQVLAGRGFVTAEDVAKVIYQDLDENISFSFTPVEGE